eukprot:9493858-Pyramimonas_sp.AAC.1
MADLTKIDLQYKEKFGGNIREDGPVSVLPHFVFVPEANKNIPKSFEDPNAKKDRFTVMPVFPTLIVRKQVKVFKDKYESAAFAYSARLKMGNGLRPGLTDSSISYNMEDPLCDTKWGQVKYRLGAFLASDNEAGATPTLDWMGSIYTDFDPETVGRFVLSRQKAGYQKNFPLYLGGPFKGSGTTLKIGAQYVFREEKAKPWISVSGIKVKNNLPSYTLGASVVAALIAIKIRLNLNFGVPVPGTNRKLKSFVGAQLSKKDGPYGVTIFNLGKCELEL